MLVNSAITFTDLAWPGEAGRWIGHQPDGEFVGTINDHCGDGDCFVVAMVDTRGSMVTVDIVKSLPTARRRLVRSWQQQLAKKGNR